MLFNLPFIWGQNKVTNFRLKPGVNILHENQNCSVVLKNFRHIIFFVKSLLFCFFFLFGKTGSKFSKLLKSAGFKTIDIDCFAQIIPYEFKSCLEKVVLYSVCKTRTQDEVKIERFSPLLQSFLHQENSMAEWQLNQTHLAWDHNLLTILQPWIMQPPYKFRAGTM